MRKFALQARVKRVVIDTISLHVEADTETDAHVLAYKVLEKFPDPHDEQGVNYCYIENRENCEGEVISVEQEKDKGVA